MTKCLKIISARLLASKMRVDTHVASGTRKRFAFPVRDVLLRLGVTVLLGHTKVDNVDNIGALRARAADKEVIGLDVPVDEVLLVDGLNSRQLILVSIRKKRSSLQSYHLLCYHDDCLDRELPVAVVEQILQAGAEEVNDQDVVKAFLAKVINIRDPGYDRSVDVRSCAKLYAGMLGFVVRPPIGSKQR
jgi:hypothetical protein